MSNSPWGDRARISSLREALKSPSPGDFASVRPKGAGGASILSGDSGAMSSKNSSHKSDSNITFCSPSHSNVRHNTRFRKWSRDYAPELKELYYILIKGLKNITSFSQTEIENKITLQSFSTLLYRKSSF